MDPRPSPENPNKIDRNVRFIGTKRGPASSPCNARASERGQNGRMSTLPAHLAPLGIGLTIASAATVLEQAGYAHASEITLGAALAAAGLLALMRAVPAWFQAG